MKRSNYIRLLWGLGFLAAAVYLVLNQLNLINFSIGLWSIIWTIVFVIILISSLKNANIFGSVFSIAFLLMVYAKPLHISTLVPWTLLLAAFLISIGLSIVFKKNYNSSYFINGKRINGNWDSNKIFEAEHIFTDAEGTEDGENVFISQKFSSVSKNIKSQDLQSININSSMGNVNVHLSDAETHGDTVTVNINSSFGNVSLFVPLTWQINNNIENSFGQFEVRGQSNGGGPTLYMSGKSSFGNIVINYI